MWGIKNQPSNSTSCNDNALRLFVLGVGRLHWGLQVTSSSFSIGVAFERHWRLQSWTLTKGCQHVNWLDSHTLGSQRIMPKNLLDHWELPLQLRASPPCRVEGTWQALWRGLAEKTSPPLSNPAALIARALQTSGSTHYPSGWALLLLRPYSGASSTCDSWIVLLLGWSHFIRNIPNNFSGWRANMQGKGGGVEPFKAHFESLPFCPRVDMLLAVTSLYFFPPFSCLGLGRQEKRDILVGCVNPWCCCNCFAAGCGSIYIWHCSPEAWKLS
jgi:hypothetical protein